MNKNKYKLNIFSSKLLKTALIIIDKSKNESYRKISGYIKIAEAYDKLKQSTIAALVIKKTLDLVDQNKHDADRFYSLEEIATYYLKHNDKPEAINLL